MTHALTSWNEGAAKRAILAFVQSVTTPGPDFVEPIDRVATFDNDGTLWCEKPTYIQADFILHKWGAMVAADTTLATQQPFKAVAEGDRAYLGSLLDHVPDLVRGVAEAFGGVTVEDFDAEVRTFFDSARHPTLDRPYTSVTYRPMRELIDYLEANDFRVFICSAGGRDFVRVVSEDIYGLARERVVGSSVPLELKAGKIVRMAGVEQPVDDGAGKPVHIWARLGRFPIFAAGNADGDVAMLETARFGLLVHHDDAGREFAYDTGAEHALAKAPVRGWTVASMKDDFALVFDDLAPVP